jgi:hypothetical protein
MTAPSQEYFATVAETAKIITGRTPIILRNPFSGDVFWVQGMHNCPVDEFERAAGSLEGKDAKGMANALCN